MYRIVVFKDICYSIVCFCVCMEENFCIIVFYIIDFSGYVSIRIIKFVGYSCYIVICGII